METSLCRIRTNVFMTIIEGLFNSPQTPNRHVEKGTGSLIRLPGVATVKWSQIGAVLMFLSHTPSSLLSDGIQFMGVDRRFGANSNQARYIFYKVLKSGNEFIMKYYALWRKSLVLKDTLWVSGPSN